MRNIDAHDKEEIFNYLANVERPLASTCDARNKARTLLTMTTKMVDAKTCIPVFHVRREVGGKTDTSGSFTDFDEAVEMYNKLL